MNTISEYLEFLKNNIKQNNFNLNSEMTPFEYLSEKIFDFTTYEQEASEFLAKKALDVCVAITKKETFNYIKDKDNRIWYLTMVNMPFFKDKLEWGTSIRGAWWNNYNSKFTITNFGFYINEKQTVNFIEFDKNQWNNFIEAMVLFTKLERIEL